MKLASARTPRVRDSLSPSWARRNIGWPVQAACLWLFWRTAILPVSFASRIGGRLFRLVGPHLPSSRKLAANLRHVFPDRPSSEIASLVRGAWENLGRGVAEAPHIGDFKLGKQAARIEIVGEEHVLQLRDSARPGIFFSGHLGNWEIAPIALTRLGLPLTTVYSPMKNPLVDKMLGRYRAALGCGLVPKGAAGTRTLVQALRDGQSLGLAVDRKRTDGALVPFFGRDAWTTTAPARLAIKYDCPLIPIRVERLEGARFRATIYPALERPSGDPEEVVLGLTRQMNAALEGWIRERPDQWWCDTNRWGKAPRAGDVAPTERAGAS